MFKSLPFFVLLYNKPICDIPGFWGGTMGDTPSYLKPIDSLLSTGLYAPDFRMPGYGALYFVFRLFASKATACNLIILAQFILAAASVYYLSLAAMRLFKSRQAFYLCFYLFLISTYSNFYDGYLLTESFCTSALVFASYWVILYFESRQVKHLVYSGLFLTWAIFLRPVFMPVLLLFILIILLKSGQLAAIWKKALLVLVLPFLIIDGAWITRNYIHHRQFIPLTTGVYYPQVVNTYVIPLTDFIQAWGGCTGYTDYHSCLGWFGFYIPGTIKSVNYDSIPDDIYTSAFNKDSLVHLKQLIATLESSPLDSVKARSYDNELKTKLTLYRKSIASEKPFLYYVIAPLRLLKTFIYGEETEAYMKRGQVFKGFGFLIEGFYTLFYLSVVVLGLIGIVLLLIKGLKQEPLLLLIPCIPLYDILIHPLVLKVALNRYLMPVWPFLIVCATYLLVSTYNRLRKQG